MFTYIYDLQGLMNVVQNLIPSAEQRNCARHIYTNWTKLHKGEELKSLFLRAVRSTNQESFFEVMQEMKAIDEPACDDFMRKEIQNFCKAFISTFPKSDTIDNNIRECFNNWINDARKIHCIDMLEEIRVKLMEFNYRKK